MNKEITCRMIDGKPVVDYKEEYVPKRGDIVVSGNEQINWMAIYDSNMDNDGYYYQKIVYLTEQLNLLENIKDYSYCNNVDYTRKATSEEAEVMLHILHENGYDLINGEVVKKRWVPKIGEEYWYVTRRNGIFMTGKGVNRNTPQYNYEHCFKTERSCQSACDKLNELLLTFPQQ